MAAKKKYRKTALLALKLLDGYDKLLSSILIGNTFVNIAASALAATLFFVLAGPRGVSLATVLLTIIVLVFCEISPKTLAKESPELTAMGVAPLLHFFIVVFSPLNYLAGVWKKIIVKIFPPKANRSVTDEELLTFVEEMRQEGGINSQEEKMIRNAIEFDDITAAEIVTPRIDLAAVEHNSTAEEIDRAFAETNFSRLPVYNETIENITGVILLKDFHHEVIKKGIAPAEIIKPVIYVTKTMKISKLFRTLQKKQSHMAVIIDEFGGTLGIVTIEDIIEELVGEIWDEHDDVAEPVRQTDKGVYTVLGSANFRDMMEFINSENNNANPAEEDELPNTTAGNWVLENAGRLPQTGYSFDWRNLNIKVSRIQRHRITELIITKNEF